MKEKVLSNIINYVSSKEMITSLDDVDLTGSDFINDIERYAIWADIKGDMRIKGVTDHLVSNFNDALLTENYIGASFMKKEILIYWDMTEHDFWALGRDYLVELKNGCMNSELFKHWTGRIGEILHSWINNKFQEYDFVLKTLKEMKDEVSRYTKEEVRDEVLGCILEGGMMIRHPVINIEKYYDYFTLLK